MFMDKQVLLSVGFFSRISWYCCAICILSHLFAVLLYNQALIACHFLELRNRIWFQRNFLEKILNFHVEHWSNISWWSEIFLQAVFANMTLTCGFPFLLSIIMILKFSMLYVMSFSMKFVGDFYFLLIITLHLLDTLIILVLWILIWFHLSWVDIRAQ